MVDATNICQSCDLHLNGLKSRVWIRQIHNNFSWALKGKKQIPDQVSYLWKARYWSAEVSQPTADRPPCGSDSQLRSTADTPAWVRHALGRPK